MKLTIVSSSPEKETGYVVVEMRGATMEPLSTLTISVHVRHASSGAERQVQDSKTPLTTA